jgi:ACR3 family arsenite efflux pump ArsB
MHPLVMGVMVMASLAKDATNFKAIALEFGAGIVILALAFKAAGNDHHSAWRSVPLAIVVFGLGTAAFVAAVVGAFINVINTLAG